AERRSSCVRAARTERVEHDLPTVGVCVACATPPVDKSAARQLGPPRGRRRQPVHGNGSDANSRFPGVSPLASHCVHGNARLSGHRTRAAASTQRIARFSALLASGLSEEMGRALAVPPFTRATPRIAALRRAPRAQLWASRSAVLLLARL